MGKPNVLILFTDQQRFDTLACAGYPHMKTPNLDRLASEGMLCQQAYSSNPVCMPARHDLMTGYPARVHGYYANGESQRIKDYAVPTLPRVMSDHGYRTVAVGKMHFSPVREHHGFSEMLLMEELPQNRTDDQYAMYLQANDYGEVQNLHGVRPHIYHYPQNAQTDEAHHGTAWVADTAIDWLHTNGDDPFFMVCGFIHPHPPWDIPTECNGWYDEDTLPMPVARSRTPLDGNDFNPWFGDGDSPSLIKKTKAAYYTAVSMVDKHAGRILDYLRQQGKLDNTFVIFTSDHGEMLYDKGYFSKEVGYEGAAHIPMLLRYPSRIQAGTSRQDFADLLDIFPTCMDACNIDYHGYHQPLYGQSLLQHDENPRTHQISASGKGDRRWVMVRDKHYKYIYNYNGGYEELYDMSSSQDETQNLCECPQCPDLQPFYQAALDYESQWGPEECVKDGRLIQLPFKQFDPSVRGKFHFWSNSQMQRFYEKTNAQKRGEHLISEMTYAMEDPCKSGAPLSDVFPDEPTWKAQFNECWQRYTQTDQPADWLFPPEKKGKR